MLAILNSRDTLRSKGVVNDFEIHFESELSDTGGNAYPIAGHDQHDSHPNWKSGVSVPFQSASTMHGGDRGFNP
ncbi:hypothetical protein VKT23_010700 [Stygiomarasmius scandens]|uniref:Uncharacterized protein n=1 Tax=Marasmiellus scandens TaxID=2682957 RepID=A0ABR1JBY9_9AGAR